ncbi:MAG: phosphatidylglycerophosphatase A [Alphaproteobacteria bacterium]|nr:phosphatidylglycerophosphatase A [Alphaproteobacteria bacterium]
MTAPGSSPPFWHPPVILATWFGVGLIPIAPGTFGSLAALPFAWLMLELGGLWLLLLATVAVFAAGCWAAGRYAAASANSDPGAVVVDEVAGQWLALALAAPDLGQFALAFVLFRLFDILKPWPVGWAERRFSGGFGIMIDDIAAALYALAAFALITETYAVLTG